MTEPPAPVALRSEDLVYEVDGVKLDGYLVHDASIEGPRPGVLVVHEWWGPTEFVRQRADRLASLGYTAFALDLYGDGRRGVTPQEANALMEELRADPASTTRRFEAARDLLASRSMTDSRHIAAIGYCMGGAVALRMACQGSVLDGVASFHGLLSGALQADPGTVKAKLLVLHGGDDPLVSPEDVASFKRRMDDGGVDLEFVVYPGAKHAFTNPSATARGEQYGLPLAYDADADAASWKALERFLAEIFG